MKVRPLQVLDLRGFGPPPAAWSEQLFVLDTTDGIVIFCTMNIIITSIISKGANATGRRRAHWKPSASCLSEGNTPLSPRIKPLQFQSPGCLPAWPPWWNILRGPAPVSGARHRMGRRPHQFQVKRSPHMLIGFHRNYWFNDHSPDGNLHACFGCPPAGVWGCSGRPLTKFWSPHCVSPWYKDPPWTPFASRRLVGGRW